MATAHIHIGISVGNAVKTVKATAHYTYTPPIKGSYERGGRKLEPDAPAEFELHGVYIGNMNLMPYLSNQQIEVITKELMQ